MGPPHTDKVLGLLWKNAAIASAIGVTVGLAYREFVAKADMKKIEDYYTKIEGSGK